MKIAVLAVQGAFIEHEKMLSSLGAECFEIRQKNDLEQERLKLQYMYEYDIYNIIGDKIGVFDDIKVGVRSNGKKIKVREQGE